MSTCPVCQAENETAAGACIACGEPLGTHGARLRPGVVFAGRYDILGPLGRGGMGMVYRARDRDLGEVIALKVLRPDHARQQHMENRFRSEIRLARRVRHPNVCSIYGDGDDNGLLYISMELVDGADLRHVVRSHGRLPPPEAFDIAVQIAEGLKAIHDVGIVHRDLKTANIMRDTRGVIRLMDFGIAKQLAAEGTATATGQLLGTPEYMSPEQIRGQKVDFRTDVYAFAIVVYEIFTGTVPFRGETPVATIFKHLQEAPRLTVVGPEALPPSLLPVLRRALAKEPVERFPSAAEMLGALRRAREEYRLNPEPLGGGAADEGIGDTPTLDAAATTVAGGAPTKLLDETKAADPTAGRLPVNVTDGAPRRARRTYAAAGAVAVIVAAAMWEWSRVAPTPPSPMRFSPGASPKTTRPNAGIYDENDVDEKPVKLSGSLPVYPSDAPILHAGQRTPITVSFIVTETGDATDFDVLFEGAQAPSAVRFAVVSAYSRWKFSPGRVDGKPVRVRMTRRQTYLGG
jgi:protein kinase-like protein